MLNRTDIARKLWVYARGAPVTWFEGGKLAACRYPDDKALQALADAGVTLIVNLHERAHTRELLDRLGVREVHLPVRDFTAPTADQLESGVNAIVSALESGGRVAVHCGGGLGRTGTLVACYLVQKGVDPEAAIAQVRTARPGSIETSEQLASVHAYASAHDTK